MASETQLQAQLTLTHSSYSPTLQVSSQEPFSFAHISIRVLSCRRDLQSSGRPSTWRVFYLRSSQPVSSPCVASADGQAGGEL